MEEKDLPQGSAAGGNPMNLGWDMPQPLFAPPAQLDLSEIEGAPPDLSSAALAVDEAEKLSGVNPGEVGVGDHASTPATASGPGGPVPMSLDSDGAVQEPSPSDELRLNFMISRVEKLPPLTGVAVVRSASVRRNSFRKNV